MPRPGRRPLCQLVKSSRRSFTPSKSACSSATRGWSSDSTTRASSPRASGSTLCMDPGSFVEEFMLAETQVTDFGMAERRQPSDGVVAGSGRIDGRPVYVFAEDRTVLQGSVGQAPRGKDRLCDRYRLQGRRAGGRPVRLGRRPHPGGTRRNEGDRQDLLRQQHRQRRRAPDQRHPGPLHRRGLLLAGAHRLHLHGARAPARCSSPGPPSSSR